MEYCGIIALVLLLCYSAYPGKVKRLESKVKRLEKKQKGDNYMSQLIDDLVGEQCTIKSEAILNFAGKTELSCTILDADDEWKNKYLEVQYDLYKKYPKCDIFACNYEFVNEKHDISPTIIKKLSFKENDGILNNYFEVACVSHPPLCSSAIVIKKKAIQAIGGFPLGIKSGEDLLTWAKLATFYQIAYNKLAYAQFNIEGYLLNEKPKRIPAPIDVVGNELLRLLRQQPKPYLRQYLSHWHKMRSSIYMRLSMRKESINEAIVGLKYNPKNYKLYIYILLNLIPSKLRPF